jgi:7-cyano-7-deazaguanine tRNA-ribosyltransferase
LSFEVRHTDLAGRIGQLKTPHGFLETPAFLPVVHPVDQRISPKFLRQLGFNAVITNAYIARRRYGEEAIRRGIHEIIDFDGIVMTDSGGYQVLEYGDIEMDPQTIAKFQIDIKSDLPVILDRPTGYGLEYRRAKDFVEETLKNARDTVESLRDQFNLRNQLETLGKNEIDKPIWAGTIQGAEHLDLVKHSTEELFKIGFDFFALGSPVEIMEAYDFHLLTQMIITAKNIVPNKPFHVFGAGHPFAISIAVALGCDTFDSASYVLYARDNRYMSPYGTAKLNELTYLPCSCPICSEHSVKELCEMDYDTRTIQLAKHNLYVLKLEINMVKQAIMDGRLWEYVVRKARSHPKLMEALINIKNSPIIETGTCLFKKRAAFFYDSLDRCRPEARRYREMVSRFRSSKSHVVLYPEQEIKPFYLCREYTDLAKEYDGFQICTYNTFLGVIPVELCDIYPAAHSLSIRNSHEKDGTEYEHSEFINTLNEFLSINHFGEVVIYANNEVRHALNIFSVNHNNLKILEYEDER